MTKFAGRKGPVIAAAAILAVVAALMAATAAFANSVNLSGGGCTGYGSSSVSAQPYGFATTVNYCGGGSWRWLSADWEDSGESAGSLRSRLDQRRRLDVNPVIRTCASDDPL